MNRREFVQSSAIVGLGVSLPLSSLLGCVSGNARIPHSNEYRELVFNLLKDWCDGMIKTQINNPSDPTTHGLMVCPGDDTIHARLQDAIYPFFCMAKATGEKKYLEAGINAFEWSDRNVSLPDGSWTNDVNPKSWNGTTVFGAIALAESLKYHSDLIGEDRIKRWKERLLKAGKFIYSKFPTIDATNVNYGATNIYALYLLGHVLDQPIFIERSHELASEIKNYFTTENKLLFGEIKPSAHKLSEKGLPGIDLGYNVEESLNSIVIYAVEENDEELIEILIKSLNSHLEFMLPDGGWDNSWGTRMFKWTYWGSRTCDGIQPAFSLLAAHNPAYGTAVIRNTELLKKCTADGLLHGGPHYVSHGIKPCIHHTFTHAKPLAFLLDRWDMLPTIDSKTPLPRTHSDGIRYFEELDTYLFSRGDWRGTVTAYDAEYYHKKDVRQATGSSLSLLYHNRLGLLCAASLAIYKRMEPLNQQNLPGKDIALTPRIESYKNDVWYTNLFDLGASIGAQDNNGQIRIKGHVKLKNEAREIMTGSASDFAITYTCNDDGMEIAAETTAVILNPTTFVLPIISASGEKVRQLNDRKISIKKENGEVIVSANLPIKVRATPQGRTFNMVPGAEALPLEVSFDQTRNNVVINIEVAGW
ncbi:hypothetical protein [Reichenbachiella ulvae]|uniref:Heparinase II/III-like protein n=1 Tax=Reichenbachiella ulvae TaxID=2980104 RepID=A0ABT3CSE5_9BACT|nr:hypothetical protein [Reichenbachiella ulvae]MCV9386635.1 hypothetical protein [Reichenbachiella ulvae]